MELKKRSEFPENELWDLTALYQDQEDFLRAIEKTREEINEFVRNYKGKLHTFEDFEAAFAVFEQIQIQLSHIGNYSFMPQTTDFGDEAFAEIAQAGMDFETWASAWVNSLTSLLPFAKQKSKKLTTWELMLKKR